jgi:hypothetical protein
MASRAQMYSLHTRKRRLSKNSSGKQVYPRRLENSVLYAMCVFKERVMRLIVLHFRRRLRHGRHPVRDRRLLSGNCLMTGISLLHWPMVVVLIHCGASGRLSL